MPPEQQEKKLYRIGEVSRLTGVNPHILRYWERELPQLAPNRALSKQRYYRPADIERIRLVKKLLAEERYTLEGVRRVLAGQTPGAAAPQRNHQPEPQPQPDWRALLQEVTTALKELREFLD